MLIRPSHDGPVAGVQRARALEALAGPQGFDLAVVGGGATGLALALQASAIGWRVALVDAGDFAGGTSSRSTKLLHGGVRYLAQGRWSLVREALHERTRMLQLSGALAAPLQFVVPAYRGGERLFYGAGLVLYDLLAGQASLGRTQWWSRAETLEALPGVRAQGLRGAVCYWDALFDDARVALSMAQQAQRQGAVLANYVRVTEAVAQAGRIAGVRCEDVETGSTFIIRAAAVVNATGVWADALRPGQRPLVRLSRGSHVVVDRAFLPGNRAVLVPRTADGRVLFALPWGGRVLIGTTDEPCEQPVRDPRPQAGEIDQLLREAARVLSRPPARSDLLSVWSGLRPLVDIDGERETRTISREHHIEWAPSGLLTVTGGKWTTCLAMGREVLQRLRAEGRLASRGGSHQRLPDTRLPRLELDPLPPGSVVDGLTGPPDEASIRRAARDGFARCVEDVLARRSRLLFLDAAAALAAAPGVARILAEETGRDPGLDAFLETAREFLPG